MVKIYGKNCIYEAIRARVKNLEIFIDEKKLNKEENFIQMIKDKNIKYKVISTREMSALFGNDHQGFGAFRDNYQYKEIEILFSIQEKIQVLILDGINDPHNFGAIIRSADAFGIRAIIIPKNRSIGITETVARVSTGAIEYVDIIQVNNLTSTIKSLKEKGFWIVGTDANGTMKAKDIDKCLSLAIVIGSEGFGISKLVKEQCDYLLSIPMVGHVNSLNASVSTGIVLGLLNQ